MLVFSLCGTSTFEPYHGGRVCHGVLFPKRPMLLVIVGIKGSKGEVCPKADCDRPKPVSALGR